jgi:uncharacterized repeat protein (TIGR02543 family)
MPANSVTLTANFVEDDAGPTDPTTYNFTRTAGAGGTVSGTASGSYEAGTAISVTATANSGYRFTGWTRNGAAVTGGNTANPAAFAMPANSVTLTANFEKLNPNIPATGDGGNPALWIALLVAGMLGAAGSIFVYRKSRGTRKRAAG